MPRQTRAVRVTRVDPLRASRSWPSRRLRIDLRPSAGRKGSTPNRGSIQSKPPRHAGLGDRRPTPFTANRSVDGGLLRQPASSTCTDDTRRDFHRSTRAFAFFLRVSIMDSMPRRGRAPMTKNVHPPNGRTSPCPSPSRLRAGRARGEKTRAVRHELATTRRTEDGRFLCLFPRRPPPPDSNPRT